MKHPKKNTKKRGQRDHLTPEGRAAYNLISKNPDYAAAAKVLRDDIVELHKVYLAMSKKGYEITKLAWDADR